MKKILILYPHWPPSNLAGVHRSRLISNFLREFGWQPIVLTVHEDYYEEKLDPDILKTVNPTTEVIKVKAKEVKSSRRLVGDIALRAMGKLRKKAIELIQDREIDFLWVPIPSFYSAIIARKVHDSTSIPYGIDYIDPWVDSFVGQEKFLSKAWVSNQLAHFLEPYCVKKASLISGVSTPYYQPVIDRNFRRKDIVHVGMPYGFDPNDHTVELNDLKLPWKEGKEVYLYAGAFLPKSHYFLKVLFSYIKKLKREGGWPENKQLYFLGTGNYKGSGKSITGYAREYGVEEIIVEIGQRFPFLHILNFLSKAKGIIVLGSTEKHYTASKIFQSLLSKRPVLGIFHHGSSAVNIMRQCHADDFLVPFKPNEKEEFEKTLEVKVSQFFLSTESWSPDLSQLNQYSAHASAKVLVEGIEEALRRRALLT